MWLSQVVGPGLEPGLVLEVFCFPASRSWVRTPPSPFFLQKACRGKNPVLSGRLVSDVLFLGCPRFWKCFAIISKDCTGGTVIVIVRLYTRRLSIYHHRYDHYEEMALFALTAVAYFCVLFSEADA